MYIIGRMSVNAIAFSPPPLSLSMIQRHDLWFVSVFHDHPSSSGSAAAPPVVNHSESLSLISINRSSVALVSASPQPPSLPPPPPPTPGAQPTGYQFRSAASSAYLLFNKLTTFSRAMSKRAPQWAPLLLHYSPAPYKCHAADSEAKSGRRTKKNIFPAPLFWVFFRCFGDFQGFDRSVGLMSVYPTRVHLLSLEVISEQFARNCAYGCACCLFMVSVVKISSLKHLMEILCL